MAFNSFYKALYLSWEVVTIYKIGEFSKIVGITTKTLRYYDNEGILTPSYRNQANGYRLYSSDDIKKAEIVADMRKFGFTISEMKDALRNIKNRNDFIDYLEEKVVITRGVIERHQQLISEIQLYLKDHAVMHTAILSPTLIVTETELPSINIASIRFQGQYNEIGLYFEKLYRIIQNKTDGPPITCYHSLEFCERADIEVCVPISERIKSSDVITRKIRCSRALCVKYMGEYGGLKFAYRALFDYANTNNLTYCSPIIEIYQKGYGTTMAGNPARYETDIYLPLI